MKALISNAISSPQFTTYMSNFSSLPRNNRIFTNFPNTKTLRRYEITMLCSYSTDYGGWADVSSERDPGESNQLSRLLNSLGINEKRYAFVYLLGFVCALAVSRVRISSIVVFPACFLVFAVGFTFGIVNGGDYSEGMNLFGSIKNKKNKKKRNKDDEFTVSAEILRNLMDLLNGFDINITNLKNSMRKDVDSNRISKSDLLSYIEGVESIEEAVLQAKNMIGVHPDSTVVGAIDASKVSNQKQIDRKKEVDGKGFNFSQFINGFREKSFGSKPGKVKENVKNNQQPNILDPIVEDKTSKSVLSDDKFTYNDGDFRVKEAYGRKTMGRPPRMTLMDMETTDKQIFHREDYIVNNDTQSMKNPSFLDSDFFQQENGSFKNINGNNILYDNLQSSEKEAYNSPPSSNLSDDILFNDYITEANTLLKQARELLTNRGIEEEDAESMLYKSTELLSKAIEMKPMSLLAVGQLGNTYLLHGELKLKLSRKLRSLLSQSDYNMVKNREEFVDYLVNVCEECEELLVKAGRKYRLALSIDGDDMRALYNWGLALCFRAQLIADIGPEAALDADKVYMAAIDKFDAMMSKSNSHTPDALFRWGVALQQRSRLRTRNFREKVKLLSQAKRLYEDALVMDSDNLQVKEALSNCVSELNYKNYY